MMGGVSSRLEVLTFFGSFSWFWFPVDFLSVFCRFSVDFLSIFCRFSADFLSIFCRFSVGFLSFFLSFFLSDFVIGVCCWIFYWLSVGVVVFRFSGF